MVDVATSIDAPIKLLAPRSSTSSDFALLGLGDIVIPGLLISLCLRFDLYRHAKFHPDEEVTSKSKFNRSYFIVGMASYVLGLGGCMWIMSYFGRAQPALLYLSPACSKSALSAAYRFSYKDIADEIVLGPLGFALLRREFPLLWSFRDTAEEAEIKDETIEPPSEAAQKAREEAKAKAAAAAAGEQEPLLAEADTAEGIAAADDSWMNEPVGLPDSDGKLKKRKNKKK
jgi:minor histocompatibility antigen H13